MTKKQKINNKGFTLIEVMLVISIISFIASIILVSFKSAREKARYAKVASDLEQLGKAMNLYHLSYNTFPTGTTAANGWSGTNSSFPPEFIDIIASVPPPPCQYWRYVLLSSATNTFISLQKTAPGAMGIHHIAYYCIESIDGCDATENQLNVIPFTSRPLKALTCLE